MIDNITLIRNNLTDAEKLQVIEKNNLQSFVNESNGSQTFNNQKTKNLTGGILIKVYDNKLKIEGSVHKYFHFLQYGNLENYTVFTMKDFLNTIETLFKKYHIPDFDFLIVAYEVGLNIFLDKNDPIIFLKNTQSVGNLDGTPRKLYINPRYKKERFLCTQMHRDNTLIFRIYDKDFERMDKGKIKKIPPCIRIETKRLRQKNISFLDFCKPSKLISLQDKFFNEWDKLNFEKEISAPPGTHQSKKDFAKMILLNGKNATLKEIEEKRKSFSPKIYRTTMEFIKNWEAIKFNFHLINSEIVPIWNVYYNS